MPNSYVDYCTGSDQIMITITSKGDFNQGFTIEGHANYAEHGQDIVCASVSILAHVLAMEIQSYADCEYIERPGYTDMHIKDITSIHQFMALKRALKRGLHEIVNEYPQYVKIIPES
jgi:uncharacterized protein YsxB (DUF464 family)